MTHSNIPNVWQRVATATPHAANHDGLMPHEDLTKPKTKRLGRRPLSTEPRTLVQLSLPGWALAPFIALAEHVRMTRSDLAGLCLVRELNRMLPERGRDQVPMPGWLAKQAELLEAQPELLETPPLFQGHEVPKQSAGREPFRLRLPASIVNVIDEVAVETRTNRAVLSSWLMLTEANQVRESLGLESVPVPPEFDERVKAGRYVGLEAALVS